MATDERVLLTVLLHHDQSKTLDEIMAHLKKTGRVPPRGLPLLRLCPDRGAVEEGSCLG